MTSHKNGFSLTLLAFSAALVFYYLPLVVSQCSRKPVVFNFGDSNSDTGGGSAATGVEFGYPDGCAFHQTMGQLYDGRLIIDFLCENLKTKYLTPYLESIDPDFSNGVNFAISGAATLPRHVPFSLDIQILNSDSFAIALFTSTLRVYPCIKNLLGEEEFKNVLYTIDIGQNDLTAAFNNLPYDQIIQKILSFISEIRDAMQIHYQLGGRKFWVRNTGPLGCLPEKLGTRKPNASELDQHGCIKSMNEGAMAFNSNLNALCQQLRRQLSRSTIIYVDIYSIKYNLIANSSSYGGPPYNFDPNSNCRGSKYNVCEEGSSPYISWDGVHYPEYANNIVASKILSTNYSIPTLTFNFFCKNA